jgi:putative transposase
MDFVHDQLATGRKLRVLTVIDIFSRFSPALAPRFTFRGTDVVESLEGVCNAVGFPATISVDQGSEFVSRDFDVWAYQRGVTLDFSRPRQTHRQCLHRGVQRTLPGGMPQCPLVPEPCRRVGKSGELAQILQRRTAPPGNRQQAADLAA